MRAVAVTGATGTFGRAFIARLIATGVERVVAFSRDEWKQARMAERFPEPSPVRYMLGDVRDRDRLEVAFQGVDTVVHAAALKRVDAVAYNPDEVIKTNVQGTINVIRAAIDAGVKRVIVLSSDKSVRAANIYGATKFLAEQYAVASNAFAYPRGCRVACVRYGNVIGSRGSVVHLWRRLIAEGRDVPLTDPRATRFWMTIEDAVDLVLFALSGLREGDLILELPFGGEVFVPKLRAMLLFDLAVALGAQGMVEVGLRAGGEKLHEELIGPEEVVRTRDLGAVPVGLHYVVLPELHPWRAAPPWSSQVTTPVPANFTYRSDLADRITVDEMRELLKAVPEEE